MVNFYGLCDGKIMVRKTIFFLAFCVEMLSFFAKLRLALSNWEKLIVIYV